MDWAFRNACHHKDILGQNRLFANQYPLKFRFRIDPGNFIQDGDVIQVNPVGQLLITREIFEWCRAGKLLEPVSNLSNNLLVFLIILKYFI